jgi:3-oxoacyl-[acyl-carrier-protein] synthase-3
MGMKAYIKAISSYVPLKIEYNDIHSRITKKTGIYERHIAAEGECSSDMAVQAAENLFSQYGIDRATIDFIIFCTQSPDYFLPTTACLLQHRLGISRNSGAFDINLGCSGFVYGLSIAKGLIETGQAKHVLLLTSETYSKWIHPEDGAVRPIFGDAATATLVDSEATDRDGLRAFVFGTDGSGGPDIIVPVGGMRDQAPGCAEVETEDAAGNKRTNYNLFMNGRSVITFAQDVVPKTLKKILETTGLKREDIDYYVFHQANKFMLESMQHKCKLNGLPFWNKPDHYGNTVSSTIPLALEEILQTVDAATLQKVLSIGFGVGLSWAGCLMDLSRTMPRCSLQAPVMKSGGSSAIDLGDESK